MHPTPNPQHATLHGAAEFVRPRSDEVNKKFCAVGNVRSRPARRVQPGGPGAAEEVGRGQRVAGEGRQQLVAPWQHALAIGTTWSAKSLGSCSRKRADAIATARKHNARGAGLVVGKSTLTPVFHARQSAVAVVGSEHNPRMRTRPASRALSAEPDYFSILQASARKKYRNPHVIQNSYYLAYPAV